VGQGIDLLGTAARVVPERPPPPPPDRLERALIVKLSSIGDVVHALPVAHALKQGHARLRIDWAVAERTAPLVIGHPAIDRVLLWPTMAGWRVLRGSEYDVAIDLQGLARSALVSGLSHSRLRVARARQREAAHLVSYGVPLPAPPAHAVDEYLAVARYLGAPQARPRFDLPVQKSAARAIDALLDEARVDPAGPLIVVNPSASRRWKGWPVERWAEVVAALREEGTVALVGAAAQAAAHDRLARAVPGVVNLTGRTSLAALVALVARAALHVAPDTGSLHIAAALEVPVVGIYGPTRPSRLGPYGQPDHVVDRGDLCGRACPAYCVHGRRCLAAVAAADVVALARRVLGRAGRPASGKMPPRLRPE
jgi:lipopolysaccharide heptosyltransferase I